MAALIKIQQGITARQRDWLAHRAGDRGTTMQEEIRRLLDEAIDRDQHGAAGPRRGPIVEPPIGIAKGF